MMVVDSSAMYALLLGSELVRERVSGERLFAPELIDVEMMSILRKDVLRRIITVEAAEAALEDYAEIYVVRFPMRQFMDRVWELRDNVTPYDAMYVALAEWFELPLVTMDARLAGAAGVKARVEVVPVG